MRSSREQHVRGRRNWPARIDARYCLAGGRMARRERLPRDGATVQEYRLDRIIGFDVLERIGAEQQKVCLLAGLDRSDLVVEGRILARSAGSSPIRFFILASPECCAVQVRLRLLKFVYTPQTECNE